MKQTQSRLLIGLMVGALSLGVQAQDKADTKAAPAAAKSGTLATVNGKAIPQERFDVFFQEQKARGAPDSPEVRNMIKEELVRREVIAQEAKKKGLDKAKSFQTRVEMMQQSALIGAYVDDFVKTHPISDADLKKAYQTEVVAKAAGKKEYKARHILVEKEEDAKAIITKLKGGSKFADLAKDSKDPGSKENGGDLGWNTPEAYVKPFSDAMTKLEKGKYTSEPVKSDFGYHVILLEDSRDVSAPSFDQVKPQLEQQLRQQALQKHVQELTSKAKVN